METLQFETKDLHRGKDGSAGSSHGDSGNPKCKKRNDDGRGRWRGPNLLETSLQDVEELPLTEPVSPAPSEDSVVQQTTGITPEATVSETVKAEEQPELRRSTRTKKLPSYMKDFA